MGDKTETIFEFRCSGRAVRMNLTRSGTYSITVTSTGRTFCDGSPAPAQTYEVAEVVDRELAVHCFNHTVQQHQKEAM